MQRIGKVVKTHDFEIDNEVIENWQSVVDILAELVNVPSALIMRLVGEDIEVFLSSKSEGNPYTPGDSEQFQDSGIYCETVIKSNEKLLVPNALDDEDWKDNPDVKRDMISYLGLPIHLPSGKPFGTLCVLDNKTNKYSATYIRLLENFRNLIQSHLWQIYMNHELHDENMTLSDYINELRQLRELIPICSHCKKIRNDENYWESVESFISKHTGSAFSHSICPDCMVKHYGHIMTPDKERRKIKKDRRTKK